MPAALAASPPSSHGVRLEGGGRGSPAGRPSAAAASALSPAAASALSPAAAALAGCGVPLRDHGDRCSPVAGSGRAYVT